MKRVRLTARYERRTRSMEDGQPAIGEYRSSSLYEAGEVVALADDEADELIAGGKAVEV